MRHSYDYESFEFMQEHDIFDPVFYRRQSQLPSTDADTLFDHYVQWGWSVGYSPHPLVDSIVIDRLRTAHPGITPFRLIIDKKIRSVTPLFDYEHYISTNSISADYPYCHFVRIGSKLNLSSSPCFDPFFYLAHNIDLPRDVSAIVHYCTHSTDDFLVAGLNRAPIWWFNNAYYLRANGPSRTNALSHLLQEGIKRQRLNINPVICVADLDLAEAIDGKAINERMRRIRDNVEGEGTVSRRFTPGFYLSNYADLRAAGVQPLEHFIQHGFSEGRAHFRGDTPLRGLCIVTPDTIGPVRNGGIGTACFNYALSAAASGHEVTLLFTGYMDLSDFSHWQEFYRSRGITFEYITRVAGRLGQVWGSRDSVRRSLYVRDFLCEQEFSLVIFQDWHAHGYWTIVERLNGRLPNLKTAVICHSPSEWQDEGMRRFPGDAKSMFELRWAEKFAIENADYVLCPSHHMEEWLSEHGYAIRPRSQVIPYTYHASSAVTRAPVNVSHLIFFGRLEKRKGLDIFCQALLLNREQRGLAPARISFVGKHATVDGTSSREILAEFKNSIGSDVHVDVHTNFSAAEAIDFIASSGGVAVAPSLLDNLPLVVIEAIAVGFPIIASNVGGIPELLPHELLFSPTPLSLANTIGSLTTDTFAQMQPAYDPADAAAKFNAFVAGCLDGGKVPATPEPSMPVAALARSPIAVCIPCFNHGRLLGSCLEALEQQTRRPDEVVIVDDGSTDLTTVAFLDRIRRHGLNWCPSRVVRVENGGPGRARNIAVQLATADDIIFLDADNLPYPSFVEVLADIRSRGGFDAVAAAFDIEEGDADGTRATHEQYVPLATFWQSAIYENAMGDSAMIIGRDAFNRVGGFSEVRDIHEDWEFWLRLNLEGLKVTAYAVPLFRYLRAPNSRSRKSISEFQNAQRMIELITAARRVDEDLISLLAWTMADRVPRS